MVGSSSDSQRHDMLPDELTDPGRAGEENIVDGDAYELSSVLDFPPVTVEHVERCSFSNWQPSGSIIIKPLPEDFIDYLNADGLFLPLDKGCEDDSKIPSFPDLEAQITLAIEDLGGKAMPKLNWSSPKDATWMAVDGTMCCNNSSDFVAHDLSHAFNKCTPVGLETMQNISPSMEFRCFVRNGQLIAISQRDFMNYYSFLNESRERIEKDIVAFYEKELRPKFMEPSYVFDAYIGAKGKVSLIDINAFSPSTDSLLFFWSEILTATKRELRSSSLQPMFASNRIPKEAVDMSDGFKISLQHDDEGR
ncbi:D123-domain-containing protein [Chytridium lagenaria]|nr:D123-domain-containing protein [Chytridium lagenaria]